MRTIDAPAATVGGAAGETTLADATSTFDDVEGDDAGAGASSTAAVAEDDGASGDVLVVVCCSRRGPSPNAKTARATLPTAIVAMTAPRRRRGAADFGGSLAFAFASSASRISSALA